MNELVKQPFSNNYMSEFSEEDYFACNRAAVSQSVDYYDAFIDTDKDSEEEFEVKLDEELLSDTRRSTVQSKVLQKFKTYTDEPVEKRRRITTKRKRKIMKDYKGFLMKKSGSIFKGWQKRYVYLSQNRICYYRNPDDPTPAGLLNLERLEARVKITKKDKLVFSVLVDGCKREFKFKAKTQEERNQWGSEIIKHIVQTNDSRTKDADLIKERKFWKQCDKVNQETFIKEADSGDILLFRGKTFASKMTRKFTSSDYDHVAMVLTFQDDDEIYLLEATSDGVHVVSWSDLNRFRDQIYSKIVWRKLYANRDDDFCEILSTFVEAVEDKKYKITLGKLCRRQSVMPRRDQLIKSGSFVEKNRTFFCSELIAKAFKTLGLLMTVRS